MIFPDEKAAEDLREQEQLDARDIFTFTEGATNQNIQAETALKALAVTAKEALSDQRLATVEQRDAKETWAKLLIDAAERWTHKNMVRVAGSQSRETLTISG